MIPGNDDAIRAIDLYCTAVANACREGYDQHQAALVAERKNAPAPKKSEAGGPSTGRRVVEIKQAPRRSRGGPPSSGGGKSYNAGDDKDAGEAKAPAKAAAAPPAAAETAPAAPAAADAAPQAEKAETKE